MVVRLICGEFTGFGMSQSRMAKVAQAVQSIRDFHALGLSLRRKFDGKGSHGQGVIGAEAERLGINADTLRKARQFADPAEGYSPAELDALCRLVSEVQPGQERGAVFGKTHVIRIVSVEKQFRAGLQKAAVDGAWSTGELEAQIASRYGSRRDGGRKRRAPPDALALLTQLEQLCERWRRWVSLVTPEDGAKSTRAATLEGVPDDIRALVDQAAAAIKTLHKAAACELLARKPGRVMRHQFRVNECDGGGAK